MSGPGQLVLQNHPL